MAEDKRWFNKRQLREELEEERRKNEELQERIEQLEKELKEARSFREEEDLFLKPGTLAEEAMHISGIFAAADKAAAAYVKAVRELQQKLERRAAETEEAPRGHFPERHWDLHGEEDVHEEAHGGWAEEPVPEPVHEEHTEEPAAELTEEHASETQERPNEPLRGHARRRPVPEPAEPEDYRYDEEELEAFAGEHEEDFGQEADEAEAYPEEEYSSEDSEEEDDAEEEAPEEKKPKGFRAALRARRTANFVPDDETDNGGLSDSFFGSGQKKESERRGTRREASRYLPWDSIDDDEIMREWKSSFDDEEEGL